MKIYCQPQRDGNWVITMQTPGNRADCEIDEKFISRTTQPAQNGAILKPGDILVKFDVSKSPHFSGDVNDLYDGQVGLRVSIVKATSLVKN